MADIKDLLARFSEKENRFRETQFLAPRVSGGQVRTRLEGLLYTFKPEPADFEGWGVFKPENETVARLIEEADSFQISEYLQLFPALRVHLAFTLRSNSWLVFPANESDARQRFFKKAALVEPFVVHLVGEGREFETAIARRIGDAWFFDELDRRASPETADFLRQSAANEVAPENLSEKGLTPEMRIAYSLLYRREEVLRERHRQRAEARKARQYRNSDEGRLRGALEFGGGKLDDFTDRGDYWVVEWTTSGGERHTSAIAKDLSVMSAGICLSGEDSKFDLQSLVGVVEGADDYW